MSCGNISAFDAFAFCVLWGMESQAVNAQLNKFPNFYDPRFTFK